MVWLRDRVSLAQALAITAALDLAAACLIFLLLFGGRRDPQAGFLARPVAGSLLPGSALSAALERAIHATLVQYEGGEHRA